MATMATDVTRAYSVLEDPLSRSLHLLELGGEAISESDRVSSSFLIYVVIFVFVKHSFSISNALMFVRCRGDCELHKSQLSIIIC